jgi:hypothetical protein
MGDGDTQLFDYWPYWKRIWQSLVFVDGYVVSAPRVYLSMTQANAATG